MDLTWPWYLRHSHGVSALGWCSHGCLTLFFHLKLHHGEVEAMGAVMQKGQNERVILIFV